MSLTKMFQHFDLKKVKLETATHKSKFTNNHCLRTPPKERYSKPQRPNFAFSEE